MQYKYYRVSYRIRNDKIETTRIYSQYHPRQTQAFGLFLVVMGFIALGFGATIAAISGMGQWEGLIGVSPGIVVFWLGFVVFFRSWDQVWYEDLDNGESRRVQP